jgi:hypothetical protein
MLPLSLAPYFWNVLPHPGTLTLQFIMQMSTLLVNRTIQRVLKAWRNEIS